MNFFVDNLKDIEYIMNYNNIPYVIFGHPGARIVYIIKDNKYSPSVNWAASSLSYRITECFQFLKNRFYVHK